MSATAWTLLVVLLIAGVLLAGMWLLERSDDQDQRWNR